MPSTLTVDGGASKWHRCLVLRDGSAGLRKTFNVSLVGVLSGGIEEQGFFHYPTQRVYFVVRFSVIQCSLVSH